MDAQKAQQLLEDRRRELKAKENTSVNSQEKYTKGHPLIKSHGCSKTTTTTTLHCNKHGDYEAQIVCLPFAGAGTISQCCPKCREEAEQEQMIRLQEEIQQSIRDRISNSGIPKRFLKSTLENYKATIPGQKAALRTIKAYLKQLEAGSDCSLVLCGLPGTGKTHLACALAIKFLENSKGKKTIKYTTTYRATTDVKSSYRNDSQKTEHEIIKQYQSYGLLILDEVGVQFGSNTEKLIFYQIINGRYEEMKPTIIISNLTKLELTEFVGDRCMDRMREDGGAVIAFDWESYRGLPEGVK